ncbi:hypothetical protein AS9A_4540 [Hoyosella subflava DQS3-9A1]|uniref:Uncharacterized protein n=1 Tax=Hoyosella subflava (strain DSM 45089 / JCM 17490 / NBRC 109087 / DQS3-9A1) TaxID=443218 RepID=F6ENW5_HOYSD|nr:hypothetical protein AS9A_4540 [Hoyosella subflava DQS3-9A1]
MAGGADAMSRQMVSMDMRIPALRALIARIGFAGSTTMPSKCCGADHINTLRRADHRLACVRDHLG